MILESVIIMERCEIMKRLKLLLKIACVALCITLTGCSKTPTITSAWEEGSVLNPDSESDDSIKFYASEDHSFRLIVNTSEYKGLWEEVDIKDQRKGWHMYVLSGENFYGFANIAQPLTNKKDFQLDIITGKENFI